MKTLTAFLITLLLAASAWAAGPTTQAVNSPAATLGNLTAYSVDLHTATGDIATIAVPAWVTSYQVTAVKVYNCSVTPVLASIALWTGANGTGTNVVAATTITGATSASVVLSQTVAATGALSAGSLFVRLGVANAAALTCNVHADIDDLS